MKIKAPLLLALGLASLFLAGCLRFGRHRHSQATSVMQFLYPQDSQHLDAPGIPILSLPLRVGIAFVPPAGRSNYMMETAISEARKAELMKRVSAEFSGLSYVKTIEIIPSAYLRPEGGFENLNQIRSMLGVDVVVLVAYDQIQFTNEGILSLSYWTIVGAYVVKGEKNDTQTLMEAAVYDIASRKMLFRAPGTSQVKASATLVNLTEQLQADSSKSFDLATADMITNLKTELEDFRVRVRQSPDEFTVVHKAGYVGGGPIDGGLSLAVAGLALFAILRRKSCARRSAASLG
jgi:rhombotail lipoprotein